MFARFRELTLALAVLRAVAAIGILVGSVARADDERAAPTSSHDTKADDPLDADGRALVARIDARLKVRWAAAGVAPNPPATDAAFLRRASLDLTGTIPPVSEVREFLDDARTDEARNSDSPNGREARRIALIERLLRKPTHATRLATHWRHALLPRGSPFARFGQDASFRQWLRGKFAENAPYDTVVKELLTATGNIRQLGPAVFFAAHELQPEELAASTSRIFLGVQISCAQCHNHPFDHWKQDDFWGYAAFFARLQRNGPGPQQFVQMVADAPTGEVRAPSAEKDAVPRFLGSAEPAEASSLTRRQQLADWLASPRNPYFAKATVNRVWALLFGHGLVNPIDDIGRHNPPVDDALLDDLAADFSSHRFDMRRLLRVLTRTRAYGFSSETTEDAPAHPLLFHRMAVKSLTAEQIWDCLSEATCRREPVPAVGAANAGQQAAFAFNAQKQAFVAKFEAPTQSATEFQSGIPQALTMMNGAAVNDTTDLAKSDILAALLDSPFFTDAERVDVLFLGALTRRPTAAERTKFVGYVEQGGSVGNRDKALADVLWALLNSGEFILNH